MATETVAKPVYDIADILRILPHRFPFLLVDRVDRLERHGDGKNRVGWKIEAVKNVTFNEPYFPGHFPHRPVMPGVLQIEAMAQAACLAVVDPAGPEMDVAIAGINQARFRRPVAPGDQLRLYAEIIKDRGQIMVLRCSMTIDGEPAAEVEMIAKVFPKEKPKAFTKD
jgi:3-hydroxyacyl-[acyl-carrier-protein] dehydratase